MHQLARRFSISWYTRAQPEVARCRSRLGDQRATRATAGFTLIEMLVVIAIIGMIMGLVAPRVLSYLSTSKEKAARIQISSLASALDLYFLDMGRYPATNEGLQALIERPPSASSWGGPYLRDAILPADPWGRNYIYRSPGGRSTPYDIVSLGPSGQEGGSDNISSSQR